MQIPSGCLIPHSIDNICLQKKRSNKQVFRAIKEEGKAALYVLPNKFVR